MQDEVKFADMAVAMICSRTRLESDLIRLKRLTDKVGLSDMGTALAVQGFEQDLIAVEQAGALLRDMSPYEAEVRALIERKRRGRNRFVNWASQAAAVF